MSAGTSFLPSCVFSWSHFSIPRLLYFVSPPSNLPLSFVQTFFIFHSSTQILSVLSVRHIFFPSFLHTSIPLIHPIFPPFPPLLHLSTRIPSYSSLPLFLSPPPSSPQKTPINFPLHLFASVC